MVSRNSHAKATASKTSTPAYTASLNVLTVIRKRGGGRDAVWHQPHPELLQWCLGYSFRVLAPMLTACAGPSGRSEHGTWKLAQNGKRVLSLLALELVTKSTPAAVRSVKVLSKRQTSITSQRACAAYGDSMNMSICFAGRRVQPSNALLATTFQAVTGAVWQDAGGINGGLSAASRVFNRALFSWVHEGEIGPGD